MTTAPDPSLNELREAFRQKNPGQSSAPSVAELSALRKTIPGISIESDRIVLPLRTAPARKGGFGLVAWGFFVLFAGAVPTIFGFLEPASLRLMAHLGWLVPILLWLRHRRRVRQELILLPWSVRCRVRQGPLVVESRHHGLFFSADQELGLELHLGLRTVREVRGTAEDVQAARITLNRFVLFATGRTTSAELERSELVSGALARDALDLLSATHLDSTRLVIRIVPWGVATGIAIAMFAAWMFGLAPLVYAAFPSFRIMTHVILLALAATAAVVYWWEHRPRVLTLLAGRRTVEFKDRSGPVRSLVLESNPFFYEGYESTSALVFVLRSRQARPRKLQLVSLAGEDQFLDDVIDRLGDFLGLPPRPPQWRNGGLGAQWTGDPPAPPSSAWNKED